MRPKVRSAQLRLRMPEQIKRVIEEKAKALNLSQTAYVERLVRVDNNLFNEKLLIENRQET